MLEKIISTDFNTSIKPTWCPGCGDFAIWAGIKNALAELNIAPHNVVISYDIGCIGNMASTIKCYGFHSLHGRALPVAVGAKLANPKLTVIAVAGDGGAYGEGTSHLVHSARYNVDIVYIVANNKSFSLTTGQASPTSDRGYISKTTPWGEIKEPVNPLALSLVSGASLVARGAAFEPKHLTDLIKSAINHNGFAHLDILQQCVTFNKVNTVDWYKKHIYELEKPADTLKWALELALEQEKMPIGIIYRKNKNTYSEEIDQSQNICAVKQNIKFNKDDLLKAYF
ncbi:MAG: thiamine pyrophosphate-dependent enzyme [Patescibacteria group bacterium]